MSGGRHHRRFFRSIGVLLLPVVAWTGAWLLSHRPAAEMNRFNRLNSTQQSLWRSFGGTWEVVHGIVRNNSDERGAKLVAGSDRWRDYTLTTDLQFDGDHGDMGVLVRSNREEEGVDAYDGYYIGLRTTDGTLVIGRSDYGWIESMPILMPGGVHMNAWYRLTVTVVGCDIAASSVNQSTHQVAYAALHEDGCVPSGRVGLRSLATGGRWKEIAVHPAERAELEALSKHAAAVRRLEFPRREGDYNRMFHFSPPEEASAAALATVSGNERHAISIGDLQKFPRDADRSVLLHGIVTLTSPALYVQDANGGVVVRDAHLPQLNVGDAVELSGKAELGTYSAAVVGGNVRLLWSSTPVPPIAVTPAQAASGAYDAQFIETEARVLAMNSAVDGGESLELSDGSQVFRALFNQHSARSLVRIEVNSLVRIRGVCVLDRRITHEMTPFVLLPRSGADVSILSAPPWWTPWHVALLVAGATLLIMVLQMTYFRLHQWRANAITSERERLAHEIHDTMAQSFAGVGYQIQGIRSGVLRNQQIDKGHIAEQLHVAYQLVKRCHEEASRTISMLGAPSPEIQHNLLGALVQVAKKIAGNAVQVETRLEGSVPSLNLRLANAMLHIGQESISNAIGHGEATMIWLTLRAVDNEIELVIEDNGKGFMCDPEAAGFGIQGMQKRARDVAGQLEISSRPGEGTCVRVRANAQVEQPWSGIRARLGRQLTVWLQRERKD